MPYVQSSTIEKLTYDEGTHTLHATFRDSHRTFVYEEVPQEIYDGLIFSDSLAGYFNTHISGQFLFHEVPSREN